MLPIGGRKASRYWKEIKKNTPGVWNEKRPGVYREKEDL
jgi:hypothetical protein